MNAFLNRKPAVIMHKATPEFQHAMFLEPLGYSGVK
jgi:hypothetical protein